MDSNGDQRPRRLKVNDSIMSGKGDPSGSPDFQAKPVGLGFSSKA